MASFESLYNSVESNVKSALLRVERLQNEVVELRQEKAELLQQQAEFQKKLVDMEEKIKLIEITNTIVNKEDKKQVKKEINDWVREIDNCITLLTSK